MSWGFFKTTKLRTLELALDLAKWFLTSQCSSFASESVEVYVLFKISLGSLLSNTRIFASLYSKTETMITYNSSVVTNVCNLSHPGDRSRTMLLRPYLKTITKK